MTPSANIEALNDEHTAARVTLHFLEERRAPQDEIAVAKLRLVAIKKQIALSAREERKAARLKRKS